MGIRITGNDRLWPNGVVPFIINNVDFPAGSARRQIIDNAIEHWNERTPVQLIPRNGQTDFVTFRFSDISCNSQVGKIGGPQNIFCSANNVANIIHEIGHAVGLWHEQSREDRDQFVTVNFDNIIPEQIHNFDKHVTDGDDICDYDYLSIMHYGRNFFSSNALDTIIVPAAPNAPIGQADGLSQTDIQVIWQMYGFPRSLRKSINFGTVAVRDVRTRSFSISNPSRNPITVGFIKPQEPFAMFGASTIEVANGATTTVLVEYRPRINSRDKSEIKIESDVICTPHIIRLTGIGSRDIHPL